MTTLAVTSESKPVPLASLVASAKRLTSRTMSRGRATSTRPWQEDAWEMYDLVGEQRFLASTLAGRMSQARLYVGRLGDDPTQAPEKVDDNDAVTDVLSAVGSSPAAQTQLLQRLGVNLFVAGDGWLAGIPRHLMPESLREVHSLDTEVVAEYEPADTLSIEDLEWRMLSVSEVSANRADSVKLMLGEGEGEVLEVSPDDIFLIRVWRPHPRRWWEADSPTRSSLAVLRELVGLTMHISAQVDSRLAGAGLLLVPQSAQRALNLAAGLEENAESDMFTEALMEAMLTPIQDRANASALVPLVVTVPDEATGLFNYMTFAKPLDAEARALRDEAIRRLALGQDAPPELLLGTSGMNHWGAWLVREDVVTTHLEPPLALICDAMTTQYLWPVLMDQGYTEEQAHQFVIWYDVSHMVMRPNRAEDAKDLHTRGVIGDETLREATGFGDADAPAGIEGMAPESVLALEMARANPTLFVNPGIPAVVAQIRAVMANDIPAYEGPVHVEAAALPAAPPPAEEAPQAEPPVPSGNLPDTDTAPMPSPSDE